MGDTSLNNLKEFLCKHCRNVWKINEEHCNNPCSLSYWLTSAHEDQASLEFCTASLYSSRLAWKKKKKCNWLLMSLMSEVILYQNCINYMALSPETMVLVIHDVCIQARVVRLCFFGNLFRKSSDTRVPLNNLVKTHKYSRMYMDVLCGLNVQSEF